MHVAYNNEKTTTCSLSMSSFIAIRYKDCLHMTTCMIPSYKPPPARSIGNFIAMMQRENPKTPQSH